MKKLSELIREGVKLSPTQNFGHLFKPVWESVADLYGNESVELKKDLTASCAIGAAVIGMVGLEDAVICGMVGRLPGTYEFEDHPIHKNNDQLYWIIADLNDQKRWTREQIADWLESIGR